MKSNSNKYNIKKRPQSSKEKTSFYLNQKKLLSSYNREYSLPFFPKDINSPNHVSSKFSSRGKIKRSKSVIKESDNKKGDALNEEYEIIQKAWEDLGVTYKYRVQFDKYIKTVSKSNLKNIFHNEKKNLAKFKESLVKLSKEITLREKNITSLKKHIFSLLNSINYFENEEDEKQRRDKEGIILDIVDLIKSLRLNSVNVIKHFIKFREISTYYTLVKKIDMKAISEDYNYDENYLKKMKVDMAFLKKCHGLEKYFVMNNGEIDAFLTNFAPRTNCNEIYSKINSYKEKISVSEELNKYINLCRYILIEDSFFDSMRNGESQIDFRRGESKDIYDFNNNNNSFLLNKSNISSNNNNKNNISFRLKRSSPHNLKNKFFKNDENKYINNIENKEIIMKDKQDNIMMSRNLEYQRKKVETEYNNLFLSDQDDSQELSKINNIFSYSDIHKENLFLKPVIESQIIFEHEEKRKKAKSDFKLQNSFLRKKDTPLSHENEELNKQLNEVCYENLVLKNEIEILKKYVKSLREKSEEENKEREAKDFKKNIEIKKMEEDHELKFKDLDQKNENLTKEKNILSQEIQKTKALMEQNINEINNLMQQEKANLEKVIEEKDNKIKELTNLKDEIILEKNEIVNQKEQIIREKGDLIDEKARLEEQIDNLDKEIGNRKNEICDWEQKLRNSEEKLKKTKVLNSCLDEVLTTIIKETYDLKKNINFLEFVLNDKKNEIITLEKEIKKFELLNDEKDKAFNNLIRENEKLKNDLRTNKDNNN